MRSNVWRGVGTFWADDTSTRLVRGQSSGLPQCQLPSKIRRMWPMRMRLHTGHRSDDDRVLKLNQTPEVTQAKRGHTTPTYFSQ